jgi:hypothetical protein
VIILIGRRRRRRRRRTTTTTTTFGNILDVRKQNIAFTRIKYLL